MGARTRQEVPDTARDFSVGKEKKGERERERERERGSEGRRARGWRMVASKLAVPRRARF